MPHTHPLAPTRYPPWFWVVGLLAVSVVLRWLLLGGQEPVSFPDTPTYFQAARDLVSGDYSVGQARRTPGYPALIVLAGYDERALVLWQQAVGVVGGLLMFGITWLITRHAAAAFVVGLAHTLNLQQLSLELLLLTENLTATSVAAALAALLVACARLRGGRPAKAWLLAAGALGGVAVLVRPQFIFFAGLWPLLVIYAAQGWRPGRQALVAGAWVGLPVLLSILAWSALVQSKVGDFTVSTQSGFGLVNHVHDELEYAPEEFALLRDIMIPVRDARIAKVGNGFNTVWYSWPEVQRRTGWTYAQASREFKRMSVAIIKKRPLQYAKTVTQAWIAYWTVPNLWEVDRLRPPALRQALEKVWAVEHPLLRLANLAFVLLVAGVALVPAWRRRLRWDLAMTAVAATVLVSSALQAAADHGSNSRYAIPTQSLVLVLLVAAASRWRSGSGLSGRQTGGSQRS